MNEPPCYIYGVARAQIARTETLKIREHLFCAVAAERACRELIPRFDLANEARLARDEFGPKVKAFSLILGLVDRGADEVEKL